MTLSHAPKGDRKIYFGLIGLFLGTVAFGIVAYFKVADSTFSIYLEYVKWTIGIVVAGNAFEHAAKALDKKPEQQTKE